MYAFSITLHAASLIVMEYIRVNAALLDLALPRSSAFRCLVHFLVTESTALMSVLLFMMITPYFMTTALLPRSVYWTRGQT